MMTLVLAFMGLIMVGMIGAGLIVLNHLLKNKERQAAMEMVRTTVIPELESMTNRMLEKSMDMAFNKTAEMTKKMMETQYDD